jgi:hypothetical protein
MDVDPANRARDEHGTDPPTLASDSQLALASEIGGEVERREAHAMHHPMRGPHIASS